MVNRERKARGFAANTKWETKNDKINFHLRCNRCCYTVILLEKSLMVPKISAFILQSIVIQMAMYVMALTSVTVLVEYVF